ncbi:hypothetical protein [uncultured Polaribacter sp.]|uniref:hypothetical protein n=1 Tax=uncultured Polaribacter sp. TaxID=174711 RepID=UPI0026024961|nr:hypothetical protein [uncultured Polaribacter sp.]
MKLIIVTAVEQFLKDVLNIFKKANIENFSSFEIDGYKNKPELLKASNWFSGEKGSNESSLFFSFTDEEHIDALFQIIEDFNNNIETNNLIRAIVLPIERFI